MKSPIFLCVYVCELCFHVRVCVCVCVFVRESYFCNFNILMFNQAWCTVQCQLLLAMEALDIRLLARA